MRSEIQNETQKNKTRGKKLQLGIPNFPNSQEHIDMQKKFAPTAVSGL